MWHFHLSKIKPKRIAPGIEARVIPGQHMTMVFFKIQPGAQMPEHSHPHEQMGTVLKGSIEFIVDQEKKKLSVGEAYHVASGVKHGGKCGETLSEIVEVFYPPREDYQALT